MFVRPLLALSIAIALLGIPVQAQDLRTKCLGEAKLIGLNGSDLENYVAACIRNYTASGQQRYLNNSIPSDAVIKKLNDAEKTR